MNKNIIPITICMMVGLMLPLALASNPLPYIIGFMVWWAIIYLIENNQVEEDGETGYSKGGRGT